MCSMPLFVTLSRTKQLQLCSTVKKTHSSQGSGKLSPGEVRHSVCAQLVIIPQGVQLGVGNDELRELDSVPRLPR